MSPAGTGLAYTGATARINYALAQNGQLPRIFMRLNAAQVPVWSIVVNFVIGLAMLLPFPGWSQLIGFITSAAILSLAFGPVSLAALRHQLPDRARPFRLQGGVALSAIAFMLVGCVVYWAGWETNWKVFALAIAGGAVLIACTTGAAKPAELDLRQSLWFWLFIDGLGAISYLGNFGGGLGVLPKYVDLVIVSAFSLFVFWVAVRDRPARRRDGGAGQVGCVARPASDADQGDEGRRAAHVPPG